MGVEVHTLLLTFSANNFSLNLSLILIPLLTPARVKSLKYFSRRGKLFSAHKHKILIANLHHYQHPLCCSPPNITDWSPHNEIFHPSSCAKLSASTGFVTFDAWMKIYFCRFGGKREFISWGKRAIKNMFNLQLRTWALCSCAANCNY